MQPFFRKEMMTSFPPGTNERREVMELKMQKLHVHSS